MLGVLTMIAASKLPDIHALETIKKQQGITIENEDTVKTIGTYKAKVRLHKEVVAAFDFEVISE